MGKQTQLFYKYGSKLVLSLIFVQRCIALIFSQRFQENKDHMLFTNAILNIFVGFVMIGGGVLSLFVFASIGPLSKR